MRRVKRLHDPQRVRRTVEKIGIAERDVLARRRRPAPRCRPARPPAARCETARCKSARPDSGGTDGGSRGSLRSNRPPRRDRRAAAAWRSGRAAAGPKRSGTRNCSRGNDGGRRTPTGDRAPRDSRDECCQTSRAISVRSCLELSPKHVVHAERSEPRFVQRRVQAVRADARRRVRARRASAMSGPASRVAVCIGRWNASDRRTRGCRPKRFLGGVDAFDVPARPLEPGGWRGQAERLTAQFVRGDREAHSSVRLNRILS